MSAKGYSVEIVDASKEFSKKELLMMKDTSDAIKLDEELTNSEAIIIEPESYAVLSVHNEKSSNKDYEKFLIIDKSGQKYVTGSQNFWNSFTDICDEMGIGTDDWAVKCYRRPSKNYSGKYFITCSVI